MTLLESITYIIITIICCFTLLFAVAMSKRGANDE